jgi:purine-nucleoside phosphorylase
LLLTNAAGAINPQFRAGDLMIIADHVNFMGVNPLRGSAERGSPFFMDCTAVYDPGLRKLLLKAAEKIPARIHEGVYLAVSGPSYETPAEIRAFARFGADAVGMSTVPEAIVARDCGLTVAGLSCITNLAAGRQKRPLSHAEVLETGERMRSATTQLLKNFVKLCEQDGGRRIHT